MKILFITPHLSTGGCPQYLYKKIESLIDDHDIYCIEYSNITGGVLVVQRNKVVNILKNELITLSDNKYELLDHIKNINPDIIHFEEMPEYFCESGLAKKIYTNDRAYKIIETSHDSSFNPKNKNVFPDAFAFVSEYQKQNMESLNIPSHVVEYPIEKKNKTDRNKALLDLGLDPNKTHFLNVGLFTSRKNQAEIIQYAQKLLNEEVQFHFVGNQAENFRNYWEPLMKNFPSNCKWWGERSDVDTFYNAMDVFLFTSRGTKNDKETSPLVLREAIGWGMPILMYDLPVYMGMYNKYKNITWLKDDFTKNINLIKSFSVKDRNVDFNCSFEAPNKIHIHAKNDFLQCAVSVRDNLTKVPLYFCDLDFINFDHGWYVIPLQNTDFVKEEYFSEFLLEFYNKMGKFIDSCVVKVKDLNYTPVILNYDFNPFDCLYINYRQMFYEDIYKDLNFTGFRTVIDIGANVGLFSLYCIRKSCNFVHAIEPTTKAFNQLKNNLSRHDNAKIHKLGIHNKNSKMLISFTNSNSTISGFDLTGVEKTDCDQRPLSEEVEVKTLGAFIKENDIVDIDLIKIDIEGVEYDVIDSLSDEEINLSKNYLIEYHWASDNNIKRRLLNMIDRFKNLKFQIINTKDPEYKNCSGFFFAVKN